jgi:hypothetical protein
VTGDPHHDRVLDRTRSYTLVPIASTGDRFTDFAPYVASLNDAGVVAFQATLRDGGSGVFAGTGGRISAVMDPSMGRLTEVRSHPDIARDGSICAYATLASGELGVVLIREGEVIAVSTTSGPLGPTMNGAGMVAFRADLKDGRSGIYTGDGGAVTTIAETGEDVSAFQGLPLIDDRGAVVFRVDLETGGERICQAAGGSLATVAETGGVFAGLGRFPCVNATGDVAFSATLRDGRSGVFIASGGAIVQRIDTGARFASVRGALLDSSGRVVFFATPRGGTLGVFSGSDPTADRVVGLGAPLFDSTIVDFALNPVSVNDVGQLAIRVKLANDDQWILRADPGG